MDGLVVVDTFGVVDKSSLKSLISLISQSTGSISEGGLLGLLVVLLAALCMRKVEYGFLVVVLFGRMDIVKLLRYDRPFCQYVSGIRFNSGMHFTRKGENKTTQKNEYFTNFMITLKNVLMLSNEMSK